VAEQFERDPRVKAWVLEKAQGRCKLCGSDAPLKDEEGYPFLEVHHIVPLTEGGDDIVSNAVSLCTNCHRRCHHGQDRKLISERLKDTVAKRS
jgi:5-methylcytosine-specific restriction protein A